MSETIWSSQSTHQIHSETAFLFSGFAFLDDEDEDIVLVDEGVELMEASSSTARSADAFLLFESRSCRLIIVEFKEEEENEWLKSHKISLSTLQGSRRKNNEPIINESDQDESDQDFSCSCFNHILHLTIQERENWNHFLHLTIQWMCIISNSG